MRQAKSSLRLQAFAAATAALLLAACGKPGAPTGPATDSAPPADAATSSAAPVTAAITIALNLTTDTGLGDPVGTVTISETKYGLVFAPALHDLPPGLHGFHLHENGSCEPRDKDGKPEPAGGAGGHYDPASSGAHGAPWGEGHAGDLPPLFVGDDGKATQPVLAPRLKLAEIKQHALLIHAGSDNHADQPEPLGGGGKRIVCGVIS